MNNTNAAVNSVVARCLIDPDYLERVAADPEAELRAYSLEDGVRAQFLGFDWAKLYHFAGLITKVQNNPLWQTLPYTRALLKYYRLEIEVFAGYRKTFLQLRASGRTTPFEKVSLFQEYLRNYLSLYSLDRYPGLIDITRHEQIWWSVSNSLHREADAPNSWEQVVIDTSHFADPRDIVPVIQGTLQVGNFLYDPELIISLLNGGTFAPHKISERPRWIGYWADIKTGSVRLLEFDQHAAALLALIDGCRTTDSILRMVNREYGASDSASRDARSLIEAAHSVGLLRFVSRHT
jgi:hypothetical protein